jgi:hypothetical protein
MKSRSIGGVATDGCAAAPADVADTEGIVTVEVTDDRDVGVDVEADVGASVELAGESGAIVDGVGVGEGADLEVLAGALACALVEARAGATGAGSNCGCGWLAEVAPIDMGAAGGSSERSWRDSSGSAVSSYAGAECVGATGAAATGVGAGGTSRSAKLRGAGSKGSRGSSDRSSNEESVNLGLVATRATKAARALVLPVVDVAAEVAAEDVGAAGSGRGSDAGPAAVAGADFA